jgi:SpoIID/LytB domain protein
MKTLIHICCAPCLIGPLAALRGEGIEVAGWFHNPNIHPFLEFRKRMKALRVFAERDPLPIEIDETYGLDQFVRHIYRPDPAQRCEECHRVRLRATAAKARAEGFDSFTTTLLGSPHRDHDLVHRLGEEAAREAGVAFFYRDFRPLHEQGHEEARGRQLYLQSYCGCCFSEWERFRDTHREVYRGGPGSGANAAPGVAAPVVKPPAARKGGGKGAMLALLGVAALLMLLTACSGQRRLVLVARSVEAPPEITPGETPPAGRAKPAERAPLREPPRYDRPPIVRVWLSNLPPEPLIQVAGACRITARDGGVAKVGKLGPARARMVPGGFKIGEEFYKSSGILIEPESAGTLRIENTLFPGAVRIYRSGESVAVINRLDVESYLRGVLGSEMPPSWHREALKAQAVAARSYVLYFCQDRATFEWDVTSTVDDQMYSGGVVHPSVVDAVRQTAGQVLLHQNRLFPTFFHSTCGGSTELPSRALGRPEYNFIESTPCTYCAKSRYYAWTDRLSAAELAARLKKGGVRFTPPVREIAPVEVSGGERAVRIDSAGGEVTLSMVDFRRIAGRNVVRSGRFECRREGDDFLFTGRGFGHGAGMCQYGAKGQADAGRSYKDILALYYHNVSLGKLY